jgi:hypothetical protein
VLSPGPHELIGLSETEVAVVAGGEQPPLRLSQDGGRNWIAVALPAVPTRAAGPPPPVLAPPGTPQPGDPSADASAASATAEAPATEAVPIWSGLLLLPDGTLLAHGGAEPAWQVLLPGAAAWCAVPGDAPRAAPASLQVIGERLWWLEGDTEDGGQDAPRPMSRPLAELNCRQDRGVAAP